jgi:hypothetical protein
MMKQKLIGPVLLAKDLAKFFVKGAVLDCEELNKFLSRPDVKNELCWYGLHTGSLMLQGEWGVKELDSLRLRFESIVYKKGSQQQRENLFVKTTDKNSVLPRHCVYPSDSEGLLTTGLDEIESLALVGVDSLKSKMVAACEALDSAYAHVAYDECIKLLDVVLHMQSCHCTNDEIAQEINEYLVAYGMASVNLAPHLIPILAGEHDSWSWAVNVGDRVEQGQSLTRTGVHKVSADQQKSLNKWPACASQRGKLVGKIKASQSHVVPGDVIGYIKPL